MFVRRASSVVGLELGSLEAMAGRRTREKISIILSMMNCGRWGASTTATLSYVSSIYTVCILNPVVVAAPTITAMH